MTMLKTKREGDPEMESSLVFNQLIFLPETSGKNSVKTSVKKIGH